MGFGSDELLWNDTFSVEIQLYHSLSQFCINSGCLYIVRHPFYFICSAHVVYVVLYITRIIHQ